MIKTVIKFCGGCDPVYDRVEYGNRIRQAGSGLVEWMSLDETVYDTLLIINGCEKACPEVDLGPFKKKVISLIDNLIDPESVIQKIIKPRK